MPAQHHKIMRQVLEAHGCPSDAAEQVQSQLRDAQKQLLPLIEKVCSDLSPPDRVIRIDSLEIELGEVALDAIEADITSRFETAFSRTLTAALDQAPAHDSALELFSYFVSTGNLPWWADRSDSDLLNTNLRDLIDRDPHALRATLQATSDAIDVPFRMARAYSDQVLDELANALTPEVSARFPDWGTSWLAALTTAASVQGIAARTARHIWWEEALRIIAASRVPIADAADFFQVILVRVAHRWRTAYATLLAAVSSQRDSQRLVESWISDIATQLLAAPNNKTQQIQPTQIAPSAPHKIAAKKAIGAAPHEQATDSDLDRERLSAIQDKSADLRFSEADAIYVDNAGLVILWPFLENFFNMLGLMVDKHFKDEAAAQRGVGLLQYIASGDPAIAEYLLPLNKLLCGLAADEVFDFGPDLMPAEIEACTDLLTAAIAQAPILNNMSIAGFRRSFLLREGQLSAQDGHWLLRVERVTYDIVLERFPWRVNVIKLPWMQAIMQVEW